ncbi:MFS transporter [Pedobacter aquatilis]|uniref:MFS transporter n=1 Tax=Pedobacter aquatilis TaxID=351343 RepID=UPI00292D4076|nr:MFS transporter [Pedobacter aquatilis]
MKKKLLPLLLGGLGIGTTEFVMMGILPDIAKAFSISIPEAGYIISAYALGVVIGAPLLVSMSRKAAPKKILIGLMLIFTVFNLLSAFSTNQYMLFVARLLAGLPHGAFFGVGSVVASRLAEKGKQAQAISIMFAGLTIANLVLVPLGTFVGHNYSWRITFAGIGLIGLLTILFISSQLPDLKIEKRGTFLEEAKVFRNIEPWLIFMITAIGTGGLFCWISYIAPLMTEVSGFSGDAVPYILVIAGLGMCVGNLLGGKLSDRLGHVSACIFLLSGMAISLLIVYLTASLQWFSLVMTFVTGCFTIAIASPIQMMMIETSKGAEMLGASITQAAFNLGNALGAFLGGIPLSMGYGYTSPELVGIIMSIVGILFGALLINQQKHKRKIAHPL